ncbi:MAG: 30S ribosomal protein S12 methylthiotransferase RimO [Candidatus Omnitrophota bacterium]
MPIMSLYDPHITQEQSLRSSSRVLKYHLTSLGCPKNLVESEEMMAKLSLSGMVLVHDPEEADLLVLNTCGFIGPAKEEGIAALLDLIQIRQNNPAQRLVVVGCMIQRYRQEFQEEFPEVDAFIGVNDKESFLQVAWEALGRKPLNTIPSHPYAPRLLTTPPHMAYLRISDGCSHTCSFCAIPIMRGKLRSRPMEEILLEAKSLAAGGAKELVVIAQDTTSYGRDLYGHAAIADLLTKMEPIQGLEWIRLMYVYPHLVDKRLAAVFASSRKLVSYLDIPIQHGDPEMLEIMRRSSSDKHIRQAVDLIRAARTDISLRTTVMVGFPSEKNRHFQNMLKLLEEIDFDRVGVFKYSREEGTPSAELPDQISDRIKEKRCSALMDWAADRARAKNQRFVGEIMKVLIDAKAAEGGGYWGRYQGQAPEVDGQVFVCGGKAAVGEFANVRITEADEDNLYGHINADLKIYNDKP